MSVCRFVFLTQVALLYTSASGDRRVRIHTTTLANTSVISTLFRCAEMDATITFLSKAGLFFLI